MKRMRTVTRMELRRKAHEMRRKRRRMGMELHMKAHSTTTHVLWRAGS